MKVLLSIVLLLSVLQDATGQDDKPKVNPKCKLGEALEVIAAVGIVDAAQAKVLGDSALMMASNSGLPGGVNDAQDAYRHCLWTCSMTQSIGAADAQKVADIHEDCNPNKKLERLMDDCNNKIGVEFGSKVPKVDCKVDCLKAAKDGTLITSLEKAGAKADPHIQKWDGNYFDYHGA